MLNSSGCLGPERAQVHDGFVPSECMATAGVAPVHVAGVAPVHERLAQPLDRVGHLPNIRDGSMLHLHETDRRNLELLECNIEIVIAALTVKMVVTLGGVRVVVGAVAYGCSCLLCLQTTSSLFTTTYCDHHTTTARFFQTKRLILS